MSFKAQPVPQPTPGRVRLVATDRPWVWLAAGWRDLMAAPQQVGFAYGAALTLAGWALVGLLLRAGIAWAILPATVGFFLVAPLLAAGLYETGRRRERGEPVSLGLALRGGFARNAGQVAFLGVALLIIHLFRVRTAGLLFALFFGLGLALVLPLVGHATWHACRGLVR